MERVTTVDDTALLVAALRAKTSIPYAAAIAGEFPCEEALDRMLPKTAMNEIWGRGIIIETRYRMTNKLYRALGLQSAVEIGTGLCPRCLEFTEDPAQNFLASGFKESFGWTKDMISRMGGAERRNLHCAQIDILAMGQLERVVEYWGPRPVAILCEGVLPYLTRPEKRYALSEMWRTLKVVGGVGITCDTNTRSQFGQSAGLRAAVAGISQQVGTDLYRNAFDDNHDMLAFFRSCGFAVEQHSMAEVLGECSSEVWNMDELAARAFLEDRMAVVLRPI